MKTINYIIGWMLLLVAASCYEDLGNYDYGTKQAIQIDSINNSYKVNSGDSLHIIPVIESGREIVAYEWAVYDSLQADATEKVISTQPELHYKVLLPQGLFQLLFKVTDVDGYTQIYSSLMEVRTVFSEGFYVFKAVGGSSDLDLYPTSKGKQPMTDLLYNLYERRLQGSPHRLPISPRHKYITNNISNTEYVMLPLTTEETPMIKVQDMSFAFAGGDDFFYQVPNPRETITYQFYGESNMRALLTDRHAYSYQNIVPSVSGKYGEYAYWAKTMQPAPFGATYSIFPGGMMFYDNANGDFLIINQFNQLSGFKMNTPPAEPEKRTIPCSGLDCKMIYMGQPKGGGTAFALMENKNTQERYLFTIAMANGVSVKPVEDYNPILKADTLDSGLNIYKGNNFAVSENCLYLFYSVGSQVYYYELLTGNERRLDLPGIQSEEVSMIANLFWLRLPLTTQWHKWIVATSNGESYKLYIWNTRGDLPDTSQEPVVYEGLGTPKSIHYVNPLVPNLNQYPYN